ncbi:MAG: butyrate kinase [Lachnospiraceae bacterium]|nr:butyrate kinase [Lachnospiraceae bacterium]
MAITSLIINPGSTSTKIGIFEDEELLFDETLRHATSEIEKYPNVLAQKDFRKDIIVNFLKEKNFDMKKLSVVVGRGGLLKPIPGGTYAVTDDLIEDLKGNKRGEHASNLGGILAREIGDSLGIPSYIVDPVVVDEMMPEARLSGLPETPRVSIFHALNQKAVTRRYAKEKGLKYEDLNLIGVHMGGGVSVAAHRKGKVVDLFSALDGDGAMSPERAGGLPSLSIVKLCCSGQYTPEQMVKKVVGNGGFNAYLGTNDMREVESIIDAGGEKAEEAALVKKAFILQVTKDIGAMAAVLKGQVDQIIVTGGIAYDKSVTDGIIEAVSFIAPVTLYPGEDELLALAQGALRVMRNEEKAMVYGDIK